MTDRFLEDDLSIEDEQDDEDMAVNYDIASYPSDYAISGISQMWKDGYILIPDYQREFVWTMHQSTLLIDAFLSGLPVPPVFFYIDEGNKNWVITT